MADYKKTLTMLAQSGQIIYYGPRISTLTLKLLGAFLLGVLVSIFATTI